MKLSTIAGISIAMFAVASLAYPLDAAFANNVVQIQGAINPNEKGETPTINCDNTRGSGVLTIVAFGESDINRTFKATDVELTRGDSVNMLVKITGDDDDAISISSAVKKLVFGDENGDGTTDAIIKLDKNQYCAEMRDNFEPEERKTLFEAVVTIPTTSGTSGLELLFVDAVDNPSSF